MWASERGDVTENDWNDNNNNNNNNEIFKFGEWMGVVRRKKTRVNIVFSDGGPEEGGISIFGHPAPFFFVLGVRWRPVVEMRRVRRSWGARACRIFFTFFIRIEVRNLEASVVGQKESIFSAVLLVHSNSNSHVNTNYHGNNPQNTEGAESL